MYNSTNFLFGPTIPPQFEAVGLSFFVAPNLQPSFAVGNLSADRYFRSNFDHLDRELSFWPQGEVGRTVDVSIESPTINGLTNPNAYGSYSISGVHTFVEEQLFVNALNVAIQFKGINVTKSDSWYPIIQPGLVWRTYTYSASSEPATSWLSTALAGYLDTPVILIYSVPETRYGSESYGASIPFPRGSKVSYKTVTEYATVSSPSVLNYVGDINILRKITVNGTIVFNSNFYPGVVSTYIKSVNSETKTITLYASLNPDDLVELEYYTYKDFYVYSGFRTSDGEWYPFDANPTYGHYIRDDSTDEYLQSSDALLERITLYVIPSAVLVPTFVPSTDAGSGSIGSLSLTYFRAVDYGETHFVRHTVRGENDETIDTRDGASTINTWGFAVANRNYYDEDTTAEDVFSNRIPTMLPIGRIILGAPVSVNAVSNVDARARGGGIDPAFPLDSLATRTDDSLDSLRGFWDLGIWEGKAIKEGGVIEIRIDSSKLKTDPNDSDPTKFTHAEIVEHVKNWMAPGIDFEIVYEAM